MSVSLTLIEIATFATVTCVIAALCGVFRPTDERVKKRLAQLHALGHPSNSSRGRSETLLDPEISSFSPDNAADGETPRSRLRKRLLQAGITSPLAVNVFVGVRVSLVLIPLLGAALIAFRNGRAQPQEILIGGFAAGIGSILPGLWLDRLKTHRQMMLVRSLPDFLDLLVACVESGLSLDAALRRVTAELRFAHPLLATEMDRVQQEIELGGTPDAALRNFANRSSMESIRTLSVFVQHARQFGTKIGDALRTHSDMLRAKREQRAEEMAQKAAVKILFPTLMLIFPTVFVVVAGPAVIRIQQAFSE